MQRASADRPSCPECGEPIGVYEPLWRVGPHIGAEPTSWLLLPRCAGAAIEALWHATD